MRFSIPCAVFLVLLLGTACTAKQETEAFVDPNLQPAPIVDGKPQFRIRDLRIGKGKEAQFGSRLKVHYSAWLFDAKAGDRRGKRFETTRDPDKPFEFTWGEGRLVRGWEQGLFGLQKGGLRELTLPAEMAFGREGDPGKVPPNAPVIYEIELLSVTDPPAPVLPGKPSNSRPHRKR